MSQYVQPGTAFCFRVKQERPGWHRFEPVPVKTTVDMAALVCSAPEFLGMDSGAETCQAAVVLSERGDARVVVAVDEVGGISLVGCPAQLTRDALTTVAQELLIFNGRLWRMPPEEFSAVLEKRLGRGLSDYFSSRVPIGWSENGFRSGLLRSLERGRFPVVLLLTEANQEVAEAVAHLKSHNLEVRTLGVGVYESAGVEVIMPRALVVSEPGPREDREPAKLAPRPTPPQRTPPKPQPTMADVAVPAGSGAASAQPVPAPAKKMPWADLPSPNAAETEPEPVAEEVSVVDADDAAEEESAVAEIELPPVESKPVTAVPPPAPKAAPAGRPVWDGTMPGVMAGKRPPKKQFTDAETRRVQEQARERR